MTNPSLSIDSNDSPLTQPASPPSSHPLANEEAGRGPSQQQQHPHLQLHRRIKSPTKLTKLKSNLPTPARLRRPHSIATPNSNVGDGDKSSSQGNADVELRSVNSGRTLESYVLPRSLRINREDVNFVSSGMEVIKLSKVGPVMLGMFFVDLFVVRFVGVPWLLCQVVQSLILYILY
jgi:hypothetical protein